MATIKQTSHAPAQQWQAVANEAQVFTVGDAGRFCRRSPSSIRRLANEMNIAPLRTSNGTRIFTTDQVRKIADEIARREQEALRR